jgi:sugar lactone lactonase YvrE
MSRLSWHDWIARAWGWPWAKRGYKARPGGGTKPRERRLTAQLLEDRCLLATFADAGSSLNLVLGTNENAAIISTGTSYQLTLASSTWSGTNDGNITGTGTNTLTVSSAGLLAFTTAINIADTSSTGGDAVSFSNSLSSGYANNFVITLAHSTAGLAFSGTSLFTGSSALTATASGAIVINSGASVTTNGGAIGLVVTGINAPLTASGNVLSNGGAITLQATGAVTVGTGMAVNSGSGTLTLAADVTASGNGDDGVGTLSVNAGATVTSSNTSANAIALRGADVNIDTSGNPALVGASRSLGTTASATLTGVNGPFALAFDSSGNLYVANYANGVGTTLSKFAPASTTPTATLTGLNQPRGLAFDSIGNLYVANQGSTTVSEFAPGGTTPSLTLTGLNLPTALAFDSNGNLFVGNSGNGTVSKFAPGSTTATATLTGLSNPQSLAFDSSGNLYVANAGNNTVSRFAAGSTTPSATLTGLLNPVGAAFDSSGNLYVANYDNSTVSKFTPGSTTASATLTGLNHPCALAFDSNGNLYAANNGGTTVSEFAPGSTVPSTTLTGLNSPRSLVFDSSGNLYVTNNGGTTVSKFSPAIMAPSAGGVVIQSSVESRPMLIGGTNSSPVAGINLTTAELAQIQSTSTGTVTIGDSGQTGNITFSTATPATTAGAALNVIQSTAGAGQIILDDGAGSGTGLNGNGGTVTLTPGTGGIQTTLYATGTPLASMGFTTSGMTLNLALGFAPTIGQQLTVVSNTATSAAGNLINGTFTDLAQGVTYTTSYLGTSYMFQANYQGGDGNDLVLTDVAIPTELVVTAQPPSPDAPGSGFGFTVTAEDSQGNVATTFTGSETVALGSNPGGSTLGGALTVSATGGVANFSGVSLNVPGSGYTLQITSSGLTASITTPFSVVGTLTINGTAGGNNVQITFTDPTDFNVVLNGGAATPYSTTTATKIVYNGANGSLSTLAFADIFNTYTATLAPSTLQVAATGYAVSTSNCTMTTVTGTAADTANLSGTTGSNRFYGHPTTSMLLNTDAGTTYSETANGFGTVNATSSGSDTAYLYDSTGNNTFVGYPTYATMSGSAYSYRVNGFPVVFAYRQSGTDTAYLYDSAGGTYNGFQASSVVSGMRYYNYVSGFQVVEATMASASDQAFLYDTSGNNVFERHAASGGTPNYGVFYGTGFYNMVIGSLEVTATAGTGTTDQAYIGDNTNDSRLYSFSTYATLANTDASTFFNFKANNFGDVAVTESGTSSTETAYQYDTKGGDRFYGQPTQSSVAGLNYWNVANGFGAVFDLSAGGGNDNAYLYDAKNNGTFYGYDTNSVMQGTGYYYDAVGVRYVYALSAGGNTAILADSGGGNFFEAHQAYSVLYNASTLYIYATGFATVNASGTGNHGTDTAFLYDSLGNDQVIAAGDTAQLVYSAGNVANVGAFANVAASSTLGGTDKKFLSAVDYNLSVTGNWQ